MAVTLRNLVRRQAVFVLPHEHACTESHCHCTRQVTGTTSYNPDGTKAVHKRVRKLGGSVRLMAAGTEGDTVSGLSDNVLQVPQIAKALKAKQIRVVPQAPAEPAPEAAAEAPTPEPTSDATPAAHAAPAAATPAPAAAPEAHHDQEQAK